MVITGEIEFTVAPIELVVKSYWPTLDPKWVKIREALSQKDKIYPDVSYGVPPGTIIAWYPPKLPKENVDGTCEITPPTRLGNL